VDAPASPAIRLANGSHAGAGVCVSRPRRAVGKLFVEPAGALPVPVSDIIGVHIGKAGVRHINLTVGKNLGFGSTVPRPTSSFAQVDYTFNANGPPPRAPSVAPYTVPGVYGAAGVLVDPGRIHRYHRPGLGAAQFRGAPARTGIWGVYEVVGLRLTAVALG
jgi:hypothetical protein